jgi:hypothetical protein
MKNIYWRNNVEAMGVIDSTTGAFNTIPISKVPIDDSNYRVESDDGNRVVLVPVYMEAYICLKDVKARLCHKF